ncbi:hypothetical protein B0H16DRAFT_1470378 [Mycena metata]|uniref:Uncharacterized protein n=1 Tax=Mycena metata TaxID=1033252 RepID=A0AAD7MRD6_9AGAR|nr:hypothetical protein B0H16DRAFT_1470378 [Mycena metata]
MSGSNNTNGRNKRGRDIFGDNSEDVATKRPKVSFDDVLMWPCNFSKATGPQFTNEVMDRVGMNSAGAYYSAINPPALQDATVLSIRFRSSTTADAFIDNMRSKAIGSLKKMHVGRPAVYAKRAQRGTEDTVSRERPS